MGLSVLRTLCTEVLLGSADSTSHYLAISTYGVAFSSFSKSGRSSFPLSLTFASKEYVVEVFVVIFGKETEPGLTFTSTFPLSFEELAYFPNWFAHVFAPVGFSSLIRPKQVIVNFVGRHVLELGVIVIYLTGS